MSSPRDSQTDRHRDRRSHVHMKQRGMGGEMRQGDLGVVGGGSHANAETNKCEEDSVILQPLTLATGPLCCSGGVLTCGSGYVAARANYTGHI